MDKKFKLFGIIACAVIIGFTFAGCEGPMGPPGDSGDPFPPELVIDINVSHNEVRLLRGRSINLTASASPSNAAVETIVWEFYDIPSNELIDIRMPPPPPSGGRFVLIPGSEIIVTGLLGGEARILVTALGSGGDEVTSVITVTVVDVAQQVSALRTLHELGNLPATETIYTVINNEFLTPQVLYFDGEEIEIILKRGTEALGNTLSLSSVGSMFTVGAGVTLILEDVRLLGIPENPFNSLILVNRGGKLIMEDDSLIADNANPTTYHIAVGVGQVRAQGGGVRVDSGGVFEMRGGEISGNSGILGGGVMNRGTFTMSGGRITGNASFAPQPGAVQGGAGVANYEGVFTMTNGRIDNNETGGTGGGVRNMLGTFHMYGGTVDSNSAASTGGGVANSTHRLGIRPIFNMHAGTLITGNTALEGGGVTNAAGTFNMFGGAVIDDNRATIGGGVMNFSTSLSNRAIVNMHAGAAITDNSADRGGGMFNVGASTFNMRGGVFSGNEAEESGGGLLTHGAITRISNGTIYGSNASSGSANDAPLGAALFFETQISIPSDPPFTVSGVVEYGTFAANDVFTSNGVLTTTDLTITVTDGEL